MTKEQQMAVGIGLIGLGAAILNKSRKGESADGVMAVGLVAGVGVGAIWLLAGENALSNGKTDGVGTLSPKARQLLHEVAVNIHENGLFDEKSSGGVKIGPIPDEPSIINQDEV